MRIKPVAFASITTGTLFVMLIRIRFVSNLGYLRRGIIGKELISNHCIFVKTWREFCLWSCVDVGIDDCVYREQWMHWLRQLLLGNLCWNHQGGTEPLRVIGDGEVHRRRMGNSGTERGLLYVHFQIFSYISIIFSQYSKCRLCWQFQFN